jgi:hypothetical protein
MVEPSVPKIGPAMLCLGFWLASFFAPPLRADVWTGTGPGCVPAPADYDGDGNDDFSLKCGPAWHFYNDDGSYLKGIWTGGSVSDIPVPADYDGDGDDDPVAYNGGAWHFYDYATGAYHGVWTGATSGCLPAPADYYGADSSEFSESPFGLGYATHGLDLQGPAVEGVRTGAYAHSQSAGSRRQEDGLCALERLPIQLGLCTGRSKPGSHQT